MVLSGQERVEHFSFAAYDQLAIPSLIESNHSKKVVVAIVDDAFNLHHELLSPFIYVNSKEIAGNNVDDDRNGYIDDVSGFDISDLDNNVLPPEGLENEFYHGTMVASIISTCFTRAYGKNASKHLSIIPIKTVTDTESKSYVKDGYKGVEYAISLNPDVICCAWSGGELTRDQKAILNLASEKGIQIIGSAGNNYRKVLNPAKHNSVIGITAIDGNQRLIATSNYGKEIDFTCSGDSVRAGHASNIRAFFYADGTSAAVALFAGVYGIALAENEDASRNDLLAAFKYTSTPINRQNPSFGGSLGSGIPCLKKCLLLLDSPNEAEHLYNNEQLDGSMYYTKKMSKKKYNVMAGSSFYGFELEPDLSKAKKPKYRWLVSNSDTSFEISSKEKSRDNVYVINGSSFEVETKSKKSSRLDYKVIVLDSAKLYCTGTKYINAEGIEISDGSREFNYSNRCECKWVITAPIGKRIKIEFVEMNTEPNRDFVWVFNGRKTLQPNVLAKFSGHNKPPIITSISNEILLWFLTDDKITSNGWKLKYSWVD